MNSDKHDGEMIELIPAIDVIEGKCVRLSQGAYESKKVYNEDPLEVALSLEDHGVRRLHLVDLDGAASSHVVNYRVLERIASKTGLVIDFGGGIKSDEDLHIAFSSGAAMVTGGSIAVEDPFLFEKWLLVYGSERIILGADVKDGAIAIRGWKQTSAHELVPFLEDYQKKGVKKVICTDVSRDGMLEGPAVELYRKVLDKLGGLQLTASGGVSSVKDILSLEEAALSGVIFGKALYEGNITLKDIEKLSIRG